MEDMGNDPAARAAPAAATCAVGAPDPTSGAQLGDQYAAKHDPFVYFHSIIDDPARCDAHVVNLTHLPQDLAAPPPRPTTCSSRRISATTVTTIPCVDGRDGGLAAIDRFLSKWVPLIEDSAGVSRRRHAHRSPSTSPTAPGARARAPAAATRPLPGARYPPGLTGPGGGRVGAVVLSPFVRPARSRERPYNHYALLRTVEALFGLPQASATRRRPDLQAFGADVFSAAAPHPPAQ